MKFLGSVVQPRGENLWEVSCLYMYLDADICEQDRMILLHCRTRKKELDDNMKTHEQSTF